MFSSVVSVLAIVGIVGADLTAAEREVWSRIEPAVAVLNTDRGPSFGVLIDAGGYFLAQKSALRQGRVAGRIQQREVNFVLVATDEPTQFMLLRAEEWTPGTGRIANVAVDLNKGTSLFVALPSGPARAEFVSSDRVGVLPNSRRMATLNEIRFEAAAESLAGAPVFNSRGELVGLVNATLTGDDEGPRVTRNALPEIRDLKTLPAPGLKRQFGPADLTTAYTLGPKVLGRVVEGFRSPERKVAHPGIGVFCRDATIGGAVIDSVTDNGPAARAGLRPGDIIREINGVAVPNQFGFARAMMDKEIGQRISVLVIREGMQVRVNVVVGRM